MNLNILRKYFHPDEWKEMGDYEKRCYWNRKDNYEKMRELGLNIPKPDFMKPSNRKWTLDSVYWKESEDDTSDEEWTPRPKKKYPNLFILPKTKSTTNKNLPKHKTHSSTSRPKTDKPDENTASSEPRYPQRKRSHNFRLPETFEDDSYIFCDLCNTEYEEDCPYHGPLKIIADAKVTNKGNNRAIASLPLGLRIAMSGIKDAGKGVWADRFIPKRVRFGPYKGNITYSPLQAHASGYSWKITQCGKRSYFIDGQDESASNWMRYVNCAIDESTQNLIAYQYKGNIYYRTYKYILPGTELLVWYGNDYGRELGIIDNEEEEEEQQRKIEDPASNKNGEMFPCKKGSVTFTDEKCIISHDKHNPCDGSKSTLSLNPEENMKNLAAKSRIPSVVKPYQCSICHKQFTTKWYMSKHSVIHSGKNPFECNVCKKTFNLKNSLNCHRVIHNQERPFQCSICGKSFKHKSVLNTHNLAHTNERQFQCSICGKAFNRRSYLYEHNLIHTNERPFQCITCGLTFNQRSHLNSHNLTHTNERPFQCITCGKTFNQRSHLNSHNLTHTNERPFQCSICDKTFNRRCHLNSHNLTHTNERPFQCITCGLTFNQRSHLNSHNLTHTNERPFQCITCGLTFNQRSHLNTHNLTHTNERPFQCITCGKTFNQRSHLNSHNLTHTNERPFQCSICDKTFNRRCHLNRHNLTHTNERPFQCSICDKTFNQRIHLNRHLKIHCRETAI